MSFWIENKYKKKGKTLFLGFSGGQGSGKTTVTEILKIILKKFFKRQIHVSSIDDFYKTLEDRKKMSNKIHPLFRTRGVPGTPLVLNKGCILFDILLRSSKAL